MSKTISFIQRHGLWTADQAKRASDVLKQVKADKLDLIRLVWSDSHGAARAKAVTAEVFPAAMAEGYNVNVATSTLDASGGRVFSSFSSGGGMGLAEMTGSPNLVAVPDPATFRTLPWSKRTGWVMCDLYFRDGTPFHFSTRHVLKRQLARLERQNMSLRIGLEVEWYLARVLDETLNEEHIGWPGRRGKPVTTAPLEPGFSYHSETNLDIMQPHLTALAKAYRKLGLKLRSVENEWGPGQVECTFAADEALRAADDFVLFRTATRQVCRRRGLFATFMARPALEGHYASGWHLHQSLVDAKSHENLFMPTNDNALLSATGEAYLAGLLTHAVPAAIFATPTVNGYRRFKPNSLAPDRAGWGFDHRGVMLRALGGKGDSATRLENRAGEPAANPYLFSG
jgi:glutamine synthetase